ncbi:NADH dehydrogenase (ubiquinone) SGDH subunit [Brevipalpus obovatus]|uniref:NADH dehydrogenase (ubiquinone) SGDH subunit n=1 Tax=Brevipalpus obovatus TaxID=246614 RepID=UPI003D9E4504
MVVLSKLSLLSRAYKPNAQQLRYGGHGRVLNVVHSPWQLKKMIDDMMAYWLLGAIPLFCLATYVNIFIGPARLVDTPEGYEPKYWEYERHPIQRWIMKHMCPDPKYLYECRLAAANDDSERLFVAKHENWMKDMMVRKNDTSSKYFQHDYEASMLRKQRWYQERKFLFASAETEMDYFDIFHDVPPDSPNYLYGPFDDRFHRWNHVERLVNPYYKSNREWLRQDTAEYVDMDRVYDVHKAL